MNIISQTNRLYLREFLPDDAKHFYQMNLEEDVIKYTGDEAFKSLKEAEGFLKSYNQYQLYGMGRWAVCLKENDVFLGWCGLKYHPSEKAVEVGYRFYKKNWNKGYATESALAAIEYGFNTLKLKEIYAHAHLDNLASHRVIEKCGLTFLKKDIYDNMLAIIYKIENPNYHIKSIKALETYPVRHPVLRAGRPVTDCAFDKDNDKNTCHLGLYFNNDIVGVATFIKNNHTLFNETKQYQLRGMAILENYQNKGLGTLLLQAGENILKTNKPRLWFNARENAVSFYKSCGYSIVGKPFNIEPIGIHYVMSKTLS